VDQPTAFRVNPWLLMAIVVALLVVAAVLLAPTALHAMSGMLQGPQQMAPWCGVSGGGCP
jgi:hypothetical protein